MMNNRQRCPSSLSVIHHSSFIIHHFHGRSARRETRGPRRGRDAVDLGAADRVVVADAGTPVDAHHLAGPSSRSWRRASAPSHTNRLPSCPRPLHPLRTRPLPGSSRIGGAPPATGGRGTSARLVGPRPLHRLGVLPAVR